YKNLFGSDYNYMTSMSKEISFSITNDPNNLICGVPYHHRPLSIYINAIINAGFTMDGFYETYPNMEIQMKYGEPWNTPRYCTFFCKRL
ncbi:MAG TPA: hypothetical protein VJ964_02580, partial [Balneolaceae bacterium]|nr:hypothetical protein [Balneolaceae bacterium]